jgi:hypothetical protein
MLELKQAKHMTMLFAAPFFWLTDTRVFVFFAGGLQ